VSKIREETRTYLEAAHARATRLNASLSYVTRHVGSCDASAEVRSDLRAMLDLLAAEALGLTDDLDSVNWPRSAR
jgi:hypothetical protein